MSEKQTILLVDDDREIVRGMSIRIKASGYNVITAGNGREGLAAAKEHRPDAIVLDVRMPVMDGLAMLGELRDDGEISTIPVVMLTANVVEKTRQEALELGARYFLEKPYQPEMLLAALKAVTSSGSPSHSGTLP